jgi:hypothetical protein
MAAQRHAEPTAPHGRGIEELHEGLLAVRAAQPFEVVDHRQSSVREQPLEPIGPVGLRGRRDLAAERTAAPQEHVRGITIAGGSDDCRRRCLARGDENERAERPIRRFCVGGKQE